MPHENLKGGFDMNAVETMFYTTQRRSKMEYWDFISQIKPLTDETFNRDELVDLLSEVSRHDIGTFTTILNGAILETLDSEKHYGCIVQKVNPTNGVCETYFMEKSYKQFGSTKYEVMAKPIYHKLILLNRHKISITGEQGTVEEFTQHIVKIGKPFEGEHRYIRTIYDAEVIVMFNQPISVTRKIRNDKISSFDDLIKGNVPAGDKKWDDLLFEDVDVMQGVFNKLIDKGHKIHLTGERDTFGYVTCGIIMDGKLMTSQYF